MSLLLLAQMMICVQSSHTALLLQFNAAMQMHHDMLMKNARFNVKEQSSYGATKESADKTDTGDILQQARQAQRARAVLCLFYCTFI